MRKPNTELCSHCSKVGVVAKGYCEACYRRQKKTGSLEYQRKGIRNICDIDGCDRHVVAHGLCDSHRKRVLRYGTTDSQRPTDWGQRTKHSLHTYWVDTKRKETLNMCDEWRNDFWVFVGDVKERPSKNHHLRVIDVERQLGSNNWQWVEGITAANRLTTKELKYRANQKHRIRATPEERYELMVKAGHKCEICDATVNGSDCSATGEGSTKKLCVDHCHDTGKLRGILCHKCNVGIGLFKDNQTLLQGAIDYLRRTK